MPPLSLWVGPQSSAVCRLRGEQLEPLGGLRGHQPDQPGVLDEVDRHATGAGQGQFLAPSPGGILLDEQLRDSPGPQALAHGLRALGEELASGPAVLGLGELPGGPDRRRPRGEQVHDGQSASARDPVASGRAGDGLRS